MDEECKACGGTGRSEPGVMCVWCLGEGLSSADANAEYEWDQEEEDA